MAVPETTKTPTETERYTFSFEDSMGTSETINTANMFAKPSEGLTIGVPSVSTPLVQVYVSGGNNGEKYLLTCRADTSDGQVLDNTICITIEEEVCP